MAAVATLPHARSESWNSSSSGGSYQLILDHILTYPGSHEIPLRTMYTLNCAPRAQAFPLGAHTPSSSNSSSPTSTQGPWHDNSAAQQFQESLMYQISQLPNQPNSLPPSFITGFVHRCFPPELVMVDFPQALTGLDYLKDLETRRRRELAAAMERLDIDRTVLEADGDAFAQRYPGVFQWVRAIEQKERKIEALYTQLYIGLRRWILLNEMCLQPFNKHNCVAMLNTLYPPVVSTPPTTKLTAAVLKQQRDGFFKYITSVEKNGTKILSNLMQQGKTPSDENGWPAVVRVISAYLQLANSIIGECGDVGMSQAELPQRVGSRNGRKVDSGVSFEEKRPGSGDSATRDQPSPTKHTARPKTPNGAKSSGGSSSSTALEKIARELKRMGLSKTDATEMTSAPAPDKGKVLRKMRSMTNVQDHQQHQRRGVTSPVWMEQRNQSVTNFNDSKESVFELDEYRRLRLKQEAELASQQKFNAPKRAMFELD